MANNSNIPRRLLSQSPRARAVTLVVAALVALVCGAGWSAASNDYAKNRARLERMTPAQRRQAWEKYQVFLKLPPAEQARLRRLQADLRKHPPDARERYRAIMERYKKWRDDLPLYERQLLDEATAKGSTELYAALREVQARQVTEDKLRRYWLMPDRLRPILSRVLPKLDRDQIESLDQLSPFDRTDRLLAEAQQLGVELPMGPRPRFMPRRTLPPPDPEKWRAFLERLPLSREQLEELSDLGAQQAARRQRLLELYYEQNAAEQKDRTKGDATMRPPSTPAAKDKSESKAKAGQDKAKSDDKSGAPGKLGIPKP